MSHIRRSILALSLGCLVLPGALLPLALAQSGNALEGQEIFYEHGCYGCHGYTGETGVRVLVGSGFLLSEEVFRTYLRLRADQNPLLPSTQMPNYPERSLDDDQVADLYAFIMTFEGNTPPLEEIPALNAILEAAEADDGG